LSIERISFPANTKIFQSIYFAYEVNIISSYSNGINLDKVQQLAYLLLNRNRSGQGFDGFHFITITGKIYQK